MGAEVSIEPARRGPRRTGVRARRSRPCLGHRCDGPDSRSRRTRPLDRRLVWVVHGGVAVSSSEFAHDALT